MIPRTPCSGSQAGGRSDLLATSKASGFAAINSRSIGLEGLGTIEDDEREVRILLLAARPGDPETFDRVIRLPDAGRIRELDRPAAECRPEGHDIARDAGRRVDNRAREAGHGIEQPALPDIRAARDHDLPSGQ